MPSSPRISIIIACLNHARYLEQTLCSVIDQAYDNLELIVCDGGSTDATPQLLQQYANEITCARSEADCGPAEALNRGLDQATGQIVGFVQADDLLLPGALDEVARAFAGSRRVAWVAGDAITIGATGQPRGIRRARTPEYVLDYLTLDSPPLHGPTMFFHQDLIMRHHGFDTQVQFAYEYDLTARLIHGGSKPTEFHGLLGAKRIHDGSRSAQSFEAAGLEMIDIALGLAEDLPMDQRQQLWEQCDQRRRIYRLAREEAAARPARRHLWQQLLRRPQWLAGEHYRDILLRQGGAPARKAA